MTAPRLTLAIPTYNRAGYLETCLRAMVPQVQALGGEVELLVSDNASTDGTQEVLERLQAEGAPLRVLRNRENIGPDANFVQCLREAQGRFVLIFGDDDVLLEGALERLMPVLREGDPGVVYLRGYAYQDDPWGERPRKAPRRRVLRFRKASAFAAKVNILFSFISGNVINRGLLPPDFDPGPCMGTNLVQLSWTLTALQAARENVYLDDFLVAAKSDNSGGYGFCQVFGVNMDAVFQRLAAAGGDPAIYRAIQARTVSTFLPRWILSLRGAGERFHQEDHFQVLEPVFRRHPAFWLMVWPACHLPLGMARFWDKLCRKVLKVLHQCDIPKVS